VSPWQDIPPNGEIDGWEQVLVRRPRHGGGWTVEIARKTPSGWKTNSLTGRGIKGFTQWMPVPP